MCGGPEHIKPSSSSSSSGVVGTAKGSNMEDNRVNKVKELTECCSNLHDLAANNDLIGFKKAMEEDGSKIDEVDVWYFRQIGSKQMVLDERTPLMVAALYGSVEVLNYILSIYVTCGADVNQVCGSDKSNALHCAAVGGSVRAVEVVELLLQAGADLDSLDASGRKPADIITVSPKLIDIKSSLEKLLNASATNEIPSKKLSQGRDYIFQMDDPKIMDSSSVIHPLHSPSTSPKAALEGASRGFGDGNEKKEYPMDPSLPDIKNIIYTTDEFRMFSFKVRPCSRAYSHDWTECPFVHPGENARRRDPRKYHYSCVPCPDFRKGTCRRGDSCEYAHGVFECWLHPAQYRTRLCKDGTNCTRRVCFFAHTSEELRPLFHSTGSGLSSPRASLSSVDMSSILSQMAPGSPSSVALMSPFLSNQQQGCVVTPPMSPSAASVNSLGHSSICGGWPQPNIPTLHLPANNIQSSRLRAELNARDISNDESSRLSDIEGQHLAEFSPLSTQTRINAAAPMLSGSCGNASRSGKYKSHSMSNISPTNLEDAFANEVSSTRVTVMEPSMFTQRSPQMQSLKGGHAFTQIPNQMLPPINTQAFSQGISHGHQTLLEPQSPGHTLTQSPFHSSSYGICSSPRRMSPRCVDVEWLNASGASLSSARALSFNSRAAAALIQREKRSLSSRELGAHVPPTMSDWGSPTGKVDWGVHTEDLSKFRRSASLDPGSCEEPDFSWVQTLVKDTTPEGTDGSHAVRSSEVPMKGQKENVDHSVLGAWIEQMQLDQIVA